ncbi:hypothetical protein SDC9_57888 [bioreactor metagenome]|uniref:Uncharacterized protein n=1 Tax=bioreactor metagenome TaxID=1076179 RepID=A0A644X5W8_9ZZZZ
MIFQNFADQVRLGSDKADAPAGHRIAFRSAVDDDGLLRDVLGDGSMTAVVGQFAVDFIAEDEYVILLDYLGQSFDFFFCVSSAGRVVRIGEHDHFRFRVRIQRRLQVLRCDQEVRLGCVDLDAFAASQKSDVFILRESRRLDDHLVARVHQSKHSCGDRFSGADRQDDVGVRVVMQPVFPLHELRDLLPGFKNAGRRGVVRLVLVQGLHGRRLDEIRRIEIRLAHREADKVLHIADGCVEVTDGRSFQLLHKAVRFSAHNLFSPPDEISLI